MILSIFSNTKYRDDSRIMYSVHAYLPFVVALYSDNPVGQLTSRQRVWPFGRVG